MTLDPNNVANWAWQLNGAGDPGAIWIDHHETPNQPPREDAGFVSGTWAIHLTLPEALSEVATLMPASLIAMGLADAARRLEAKTREAVALCRAEGLPWSTIGTALGVSRQAAWERYAKD